MPLPIAIVIAVAVCATYATSGVGKLLAASTSIQGLATLQLPEGLRTPLIVRLVAIAEITLATAALVLPWPIAATLAWVGLLLFSALVLVVMTRAVMRGVQGDCHCFGALPSEPVGWMAAARNLLLLAGVVVALTSPVREGILRSYLALDATEQAIALLGAMAIAAAVWRTISRAGRAVVSAPANRRPLVEIPHVHLTDFLGRSHTIRRFRGEAQSILLFARVDCGSCHETAAWMLEKKQQLGDLGVSVAIVTPSPIPEAQKSFPDWGFDVLWDQGSEAAQALDISATPAAVHLGADGTATITEGPVAGQMAIELMVENCIAARS